LSEDICEHLDELIDNDTDPNLQKLAHIFSGTKDHEQEFHHLYGRPCWIPASLWMTRWRCSSSAYFSPIDLLTIRAARFPASPLEPTEQRKLIGKRFNEVKG
jgi:hypothetical protein